jgi:hypothetical protein
MRLRRFPTVLCAAAIAPIAVAALVNAPAVATPGVTPPPLPSVGLSNKPAVGTPALTAVTKSVQQVRQLVQCGARMYAVGTFSSITQGGKTYTRHNVLSFSATAPYKLTSWHPTVHGKVNSIAFVPNQCNVAYLGGQFTLVNSRHVHNIAAVGTSTGRVLTKFKGSVNKPVQTLLVWNKRHLLTGGLFTKVNGSTRHPIFVSLNPKTGRDDGYLTLPISGEYHFQTRDGTPADANTHQVFNQQVSPNRKHLMIEGVFTKIGVAHRQQIAMLNLNKKHATVSKWYAPEFNRHCSADEPFYVHAAAWSPDGKHVYTATTGYLPANGAGSLETDTRSGPCDSVEAFSSKAAHVSHAWANYTGCDSLYSVAATSKTITAGGHQRWADNNDGCDDDPTNTATLAQGMVGLAPGTGKVNYNPSRARGEGADDMMVTSAGLWIASDNFDGAEQCGGVKGHSGICLLPRD